MKFLLARIYEGDLFAGFGIAVNGELLEGQLSSRINTAASSWRVNTRMKGTWVFIVSSKQSVYFIWIDESIFLSAVSLRRQASMTHAEKFPAPFLSRAKLLCSIIWFGKRILRVVVLRGRFFDDIVCSFITESWRRFYMAALRILQSWIPPWAPDEWMSCRVKTDASVVGQG